MKYYITIKQKAPKAEHFVIDSQHLKKVVDLLSGYHEKKVEKKEKKIENKEKKEDLSIKERDKLVIKIWKKDNVSGAEAVRRSGYKGERADQEWQRVKKRNNL
jgi:hypothetical protein